TSTWVPGSISGDGAITNLGALTVAAIQGKSVKSGTPGAGQVLTWNNSTTQWDFETASGGSVTQVISGTGLVAGTITNLGTINVDVGTTANKILQITSGMQYPAVDGNLITNVNAANIRGRNVSSTGPTDAQVLLYNNTTSTWVPSSVTGDASVTNLGALTVFKIQGNTVSANGPAANQVLTWNGTTAQWQAMAPPTSGTITSNGTLTLDVGTTANQILQITAATQYPIVDGNLITNVNAFNIRGRSVSSAGPTDAQVLLYNNTTSTWVPSS